MAQVDYAHIANRLDDLETAAADIANGLANQEMVDLREFGSNLQQINGEDLSLGDTLKIGIAMQKFPQLTETNQIGATKVEDLRSKAVQKMSQKYS